MIPLEKQFSVKLLLALMSCNVHETLAFNDVSRQEITHKLFNFFEKKPVEALKIKINI